MTAVKSANEAWFTRVHQEIFVKALGFTVGAKYAPMAARSFRDLFPRSCDARWRRGPQSKFSNS